MTVMLGTEFHPCEHMYLHARVMNRSGIFHFRRQESFHTCATGLPQWWLLKVRSGVQVLLHATIRKKFVKRL